MNSPTTGGQHAASQPYCCPLCQWLAEAPDEDMHEWLERSEK